ncbi:MAG: hypothetical protein JW729_03125 [Bacteroidales bacterium]|nr:hypothetical protein [Bacteroidales bacterium]
MGKAEKIALQKTTLLSSIEIAKHVFVLSFSRTEDFRPGQMVALALNPNEPFRLYSIASGNTQNEYRILFNIQTEGFLTPKLAELKAGQTVYISKPFGSFYGTLENDWWIAAGTGIAPFISMLESGMGKNKTLIHGGRSKESFYFADRIRALLDGNYIQCSSVLKQEGIYPDRLTTYLENLEYLPTDKNYYICGSSQLIVDVRDILINRGVAYNKIIAEIYF